MIKVFVKFFLLLFPLILLAPFVIQLILKGEIYFSGVNGLVNCHLKKEPCLIGLKYTNPDLQLKLKMAKILKPEILVLGTSRTMQISHHFFKNQSFYNAGGGVKTIAHFRKFLDDLGPSYYPKLLIIGLDQNFFNPNWDNMSGGLEFPKKM